MLDRLFRGVKDYVSHLAHFNRNVRLCFLASMLSGMAQGAFTVIFNLYIVALGIGPEVLGRILSAGPFAQAVGSIPAGFLAEIIGYKSAFAIIYGATGLSQIAQVASANALLIFAAAFVGGLAFAGDFVVRLPFLAANTSESERTHVFSLSSLIFSMSLSLGALLAGYGPDLLRSLTSDLIVAYRYTLYAAGALTLLSLFPIALIKAQAVRARHKISLHPYLWGMDRFTVQAAIASGFVGIAQGLVGPFLNLYFVYHLGTTREFFGNVTALSLLPVVLAVALGPAIAMRMGKVRSVTILRLLVPLSLFLMAVTTQPLLGTAGYWAYRALFMMSQPISFAFAMQAAERKAVVAASAWLNVTYWLGNAIAAPVTGIYLAHLDYATPFYLAAVAAVLAGLSNQIFFAPKEKLLKDKASS